MIHFWENTFWNKTSLSFVFRGPNSSVPWGFQACWSQWYWFQSYTMIHFWENTFWNKTSLSFVFRGPNSSVPWGFQACWSQGYKFQSCTMICFWENTFWAKISLSFVFGGPNSSVPWGFQACWSQWYKFQSCTMIHFWKNTFWNKTSLSLYLEGQTQVYPEVFRHADPNGTGFKVVWWSISEKTHFGIKHHFPLYLEGQTKWILRFPGMPITMVQVSKLYNDPFLKKKNTFWNKTSLSFVFGGPNSADPEVFRCVNCNGPSFKAVWWSISDKTHCAIKHHFPMYLEGQTQQTLRFSGVSLQWSQFQSCMMICFCENTFWNKTSFSFVFRGPNSAHPEVLRHANCIATSVKAVCWSISEKTHFGIKHHFPLYLEGQTKCTLRFSGMPITMVQVSKLYDDPFLRKHILE